jgi:3-oxoacyl-[acyl-carrier protein] reductase
MKRLEGRVAWVTGGQRGLGAACVSEFAAEGAECYVNYPTPTEAAEAAEFIESVKGAPVHALQADVTDEKQIRDLVDHIVAKSKHLDILVNNAGVNTLRTWETLDRESWELTMSVNLTGVFNCCRAVLEQMQQQRRGNIINIASIAAFIGRGNADYIASKSALLGLTRSLARQYGKFGIRANSISPGFHNTEMVKRARQGSAENADEFIKQTPLGFFPEPDSIGKAALFLVSDDAAFITGHNLVVDGGLTLR